MTTEFLVFAEPLLVKGSSTEFCFFQQSTALHLSSGGAFILGGVIQSLSSSLFMHACDTYASIGSAFSCQEPDAQLPWALEYFFLAVVLVITVLCGKEGVRSTYDGHISPVSSQRTGI